MYHSTKSQCITAVAEMGSAGEASRSTGLASAGVGDAKEEEAEELEPEWADALEKS
jgi:hypothetical protein